MLINHIKTLFFSPYSSLFMTPKYKPLYSSKFNQALSTPKVNCTTLQPDIFKPFFCYERGIPLYFMKADRELGKRFQTGHERKRYGCKDQHFTAQPLTTITVTILWGMLLTQFFAVSATSGSCCHRLQICLWRFGTFVISCPSQTFDFPDVFYETRSARLACHGNS